MKTMAMSPAQEEIINTIQKHIDLIGGELDSWYIGIAANLRKKLFEEHNVSEQNGKWIYRTLDSNLSAREIEQYFISLGLDNREVDDDSSGTVLFAYRKNTISN